MNNVVTSKFDFPVIVLDNRTDAEKVMTLLEGLLERYEQVTVGDLSGLVGIETTFRDEKYGWTTLKEAEITCVRVGYLLDLPKPELLA